MKYLIISILLLLSSVSFAKEPCGITQENTLSNLSDDDKVIITIKEINTADDSEMDGQLEFYLDVTLQGDIAPWPSSWRNNISTRLIKSPVYDLKEGTAIMPNAKLVIKGSLINEEMKNLKDDGANYSYLKINLMEKTLGIFDDYAAQGPTSLKNNSDQLINHHYSDNFKSSFAVIKIDVERNCN